TLALAGSFAPTSNHTPSLTGPKLGLENARQTGYFCVMRRSLLWLSLLCCLALGPPAQAATGRVLKVLPHFLDLEGRNTRTPSLYDRDAYQFFLREHPEKRSAIRFDVQWKAKGPFGDKLKLRLEVRGIAQGNLPKQLVVECPVEPPGWFSRWNGLALSGDEYKQFGEVTAWRVTLWENDRLLGEQKSFLW
ncbi:MAG: hypothetical protein QOJ40_2855, partial [Verrucomicrobiota bacterium]